MITSVKIKDNTKTPFEYVSDIEAFENGREFIFKPGVNVIVGKNGSGKSTLLNIISMYALCEKSMCSEIPIEALDFPPIFDDDDDDKVLDGIDISSDYAGKVFRLLPSAEINRGLAPMRRRKGVIINKKLRNAIKKAENKQNEADLALQSIWEHLAFSGFRDNEPNLSMASGNEIILEWNGSEMNANEIIDRMESVGYITPDDFIGG